jgi:hypothetical protein
MNLHHTCSDRQKSVFACVSKAGLWWRDDESKHRKQNAANLPRFCDETRDEDKVKIRLQKNYRK